MVLTEDEQRVLDHLLQLPPDYEMAECSLREKNLSSTSIPRLEKIVIITQEQHDRISSIHSAKPAHGEWGIPEGALCRP